MSRRSVRRSARVTLRHEAWDSMSEVVERGWGKLQHHEDEGAAAAADMLRRVAAHGPTA
ncbi:MAG: hypothetical protein WCJ64_07455 [Rhodospirillaceae bacterium]